MLFSQQQVLETIAWRQRQNNDRLNLEVGHRIRTEFSDVFDVVASLTAPVGRSVCRPQQPLQPRAARPGHRRRAHDAAFGGLLYNLGSVRNPKKSAFRLSQPMLHQPLHLNVCCLLGWRLSFRAPVLPIAWPTCFLRGVYNDTTQLNSTVSTRRRVVDTFTA